MCQADSAGPPLQTTSELLHSIKSHEVDVRGRAGVPNRQVLKPKTDTCQTKFCTKDTD
jgi:hypothetical protein